jgi:hypothetical protein
MAVQNYARFASVLLTRQLQAERIMTVQPARLVTR